jgi:hypothetical protein
MEFPALRGRSILVVEDEVLIDQILLDRSLDSGLQHYQSWLRTPTPEGDGILGDVILPVVVLMPMKEPGDLLLQQCNLTRLFFARLMVLILRVSSISRQSRRSRETTTSLIGTRLPKACSLQHL